MRTARPLLPMVRDSGDRELRGKRPAGDRHRMPGHTYTSDRSVDPWQGCRNHRSSIDRCHPVLLADIPKRIGFLVEQRIAVVGDGYSKLVGFYKLGHQIDRPACDAKVL